MAYSDRFPIVKNFFETQLVVACDAGATELHLADVGGLPAVLVGRDYIPLVVRKATGSREIVYVESVDAGSGTVRVQRGQEGTLATSWDVGAYVYCTVTAESFQRMRVNGFAPLVDPDGGRPAITRTSATAISITGDFSSQIEVGMAARVLSGNTVVVPSDATLGAIFVGSVSYSGGKTLVGLQNVSLPSTVSGLDLGLSVASAPLYHPDTPLGDGETITMEGGLLKITDKFKQAQSTRDSQQDAAISTAKSEAASANSTLESALRSLVSTEKAALQGQIQKVVPAGTVIAFAANKAPDGFLLCNGATVSRTTYAALFSAIGTTYGAGNDSTTFALPNLTDKFIQGSGTAGTSKAAGLPGITGAFCGGSSNVYGINDPAVSGAFGKGAGTTYHLGGSVHASGNVINFDASRSSSIYGASTTVQPPALAMRYYIKY